MEYLEALVSGSETPSIVPFQFCELVKTPPEGDRWIHEVRFDGYRMQLRVDCAALSWRTRNPHDWSPQLTRLTKAMPALPDGIFETAWRPLSTNA